MPWLAPLAPSTPASPKFSPADGGRLASAGPGAAAAAAAARSAASSRAAMRSCAAASASCATSVPFLLQQGRVERAGAGSREAWAAHDGSRQGGKKAPAFGSTGWSTG